MHHHNCFIIGSIARSLNDQVSNQFLVKCFSNSVDEIYFEFNHFAFRCNFYKGELFFNFDNDIVGENRLFKPQFKELVNYKAIGVVPHPYERSFHIEFDNGLRLAFKCFGRKANVLLFEKDTVINQFRKNIETDQDLIWTDMVRAIKPIYEEKAFLSLQNFNEIYPYFPAEFSGAIKTEADFKNTLLAYNSATDIKINEVPLSLSFDLKSQENNVLNAITNYTSVYLKTKIFSTTKAELVLVMLPNT
jgi:hypothetical protein